MKATADVSFLSTSSKGELSQDSSISQVAPTPRINNISSIQQTSLTNAEIFSKEFRRLQEQQVIFLNKLEKERKRTESIEAKTLDAKAQLRSLMEKTRGGSIKKEIDATSQRQIGRVETNLQLSRIKLSVARNGNSVLKKKIDSLRKDKLLQINILSDMLKDTNETKNKIKHFQKEILKINEQKHKLKLTISFTKTKMTQEMEEFSNKITSAKQNISENQAAMLETIRDKLSMTNEAGPFSGSRATTASQSTAVARKSARVMSGLSTGYRPPSVAAHARPSEAVAEVLSETGYSSVEELLEALQQSEEAMFSLYNDTQEKNEDLEKLQSENKRLEGDIHVQMNELNSLESKNEQKKQDLEKSILALKTSISKYDTEYNRNMELLNSVSEMLMNLLKNLAVDEEQLDQQLLSTGISDRNIDSFLGLVEQRIDDLIQMSKAAQHQSIRREDFMKVAVASDKMNVFQPPTLPSLADNNDDGDFDDPEDSSNGGKLQPVNIAALKEMMNRKVQKIAVMKPKVLNALASASMGLDSRQSSKRSMRSNPSGEQFNGLM